MDNDTGGCFVSQEKLALGSGCTRATVRRHLRQVEADGWLKTWRHGGEGQSWAMTHYQAVIPPGLPKKDACSEDATLGKRMRDSGPKDALSEPKGGVPRPRTNSFNSSNSMAEDGLLEGPPPPISGREDPVKVEQKHREAFQRLGKEGRAFAAEQIAPGFPPERVNERSLALMSPERFEAVQAWLAKQEK